MTTITAPTLDQRVLDATTGALELFGIYLGTRLGLYAAVHEQPGEHRDRAGRRGRHRPALRPGMARAAGRRRRPRGGRRDRRRRSPPLHPARTPTSASSSTRSPWTTSPRWPRWSSGSPRCSTRWPTPTAPAAEFRTPATAPEFRAGQGGINRPAFTSALVEEWLPALGPTAERLAGGGRLADLGCGQGWSTIAVARAYPTADVWGFDLDPASIADARATADARTRAARLRGRRRRRAQRRRALRCRR